MQTRRVARVRALLRLHTLAVLFACALMPVAHAQQSDADAKAELEATFQRLLVKPSDRVLNRRLVDLATRLKDYDTAIGAVERLIFYSPNDGALHLEAARLYFQINSNAAAAGYLKDALALRLTPEQRAEATLLMARVDKKVQPRIWDVFFQSGLRYQSNANVGSREFDPSVFEAPVSDWNSFAATTFSINAPINKNVSFEASASGYYSDQLKVNRLDLGFAEFMAGPRFSTDNGTFSFKPYGVTQGLTLDRSPYQWAVGGGGFFRLTFKEGWYVEPQGEYKQRNYFNSTNYPTATDQDGNVIVGAVNVRATFNEHFAVSGRGSYTRNDASAAFQAYEQFQGNLALLANFDLFGLENWTLSPYGRVSFTNYMGLAPPEVAQQEGPVRSDMQWAAGISLEVPVVDHIKAGVQVEYTRNSSNLNRFIYDNLQVMTGPVLRY